MFFMILVFLTAFFMESVGTVISVIGITKFLGVSPITISLAIIFDIAKLVSVSFLYKEWKTIPFLLKVYMIPASIVLVVFTSTGAALFLTAELQKALIPSTSISVKVSSLEDEKAKLELRKTQIDEQIANLPTNSVKGRTKLIDNFKNEITQVNSRLVELDQELPEFKLQQIDVSAHSNTINSFAKIIGVSIDTAMAWIIGIIIFVFDPLAIALILSGNYLIMKRNDSQIKHCAEENVKEKLSDSLFKDDDDNFNPMMGVQQEAFNYEPEFVEPDEPIFIPEIEVPEPEIAFDDRRKARVYQSSLNLIDGDKADVEQINTASEHSKLYRGV
jgi:hypothetical protein